MKNLVIIVTILIYLSSCKQKSTVKTGMEGTQLPTFNLLLMDSTTDLSVASLNSEKPIVLLYITPECPFCRAQTQEIIDKIASLNDIHFYLFSDFPFNQIKNYYNYYGLNKYSNITVGQDYNVYFKKHFKALSVPYIAIYGKDKALKEVLIGKVDPDIIKNIVLRS